MIDLDLERELAPLVDAAPEAPPIERVHGRARTRRRRRLGTVAVGVVLVVGASVARHGRARRDRVISAPTIATTPTSPAPAAVPTDTFRVTTPAGTSLTITAAHGLGLAHLPVSFNAQITSAALVPEFTGQRVVVQDVAAPTPRTCWSGYTYGHWRLLLSCGSDAEHQLHPRPARRRGQRRRLPRVPPGPAADPRAGRRARRRARRRRRRVLRRRHLPGRMPDARAGDETYGGRARRAGRRDRRVVVRSGPAHACARRRPVADRGRIAVAAGPRRRAHDRDVVVREDIRRRRARFRAGRSTLRRDCAGRR